MMGGHKKRYAGLPMLIAARTKVVRQRDQEQRRRLFGFSMWDFAHYKPAQRKGYWPSARPSARSFCCSFSDSLSDEGGGDALVIDLSRVVLPHRVPRSESQRPGLPIHLLWVSVCHRSWTTWRRGACAR